jgi:hypothetical protein
MRFEVILLGLEVFFLAGDRIRFDARLRPQFTENQVRHSSEATRAGLLRWASTEQGQKLITWFSRNDCEVVITEDLNESGPGRAPQPPIATLVAATDRSTLKIYEVILNPLFYRLPEGMKPWGRPATPADMMAAAWGGEILHVYFYSRGISLPHHARADFQEEWRVMAAELGFAGMSHEDGEEGISYAVRHY